MRVDTTSSNRGYPTVELAVRRSALAQRRWSASDRARPSSPSAATAGAGPGGRPMPGACEVVRRRLAADDPARRRPGGRGPRPPGNWRAKAVRRPTAGGTSVVGAILAVVDHARRAHQQVTRIRSSHEGEPAAERRQGSTDRQVHGRPTVTATGRQLGAAPGAHDQSPHVTRRHPGRTSRGAPRCAADGRRDVRRFPARRPSLR